MLSRYGPVAGPVTLLFALGLLQLPHWQLRLLGFILPPLAIGSRPPAESQLGTYPVGLNHASPGVELNCFQPRSLLLFHPDWKLKGRKNC